MRQELCSQSAHLCPTVDFFSRSKMLGTPNSRGCVANLPTCGRGAKSAAAHNWADWLHNPCLMGGGHILEQETQQTMAHKWGDWLHDSYRLGGSQRF